MTDTHNNMDKSQSLVLSERSQTQSITYFLITFMWLMDEIKTIGTEDLLVVPGQEIDLQGQGKIFR